MLLPVMLVMLVASSYLGGCLVAYPHSHARPAALLLLLLLLSSSSLKLRRLRRLLLLLLPLLRLPALLAPPHPHL